MARRPITEIKELNKKSGLVGFEAIWQHILDVKNKPFTVKDIEMQTNVRRDTVRDYINRLKRAGYLEKLPDIRQTNTQYKAYLYKAIKRPLKAPRLQRDGTVVTQGRGRDQMWRTIKMIGAFTAKDLAVSATTKEVKVAEGYAEDYIKFLYRAGYLKCTKAHKVSGGKATYRLLPGKNTGPKPPQIQRTKEVFDPNLEKVMWSSKGGLHE